MKFLASWLATAVAAAVAVALIPGMVPTGDQIPSILLFSLSIALVNASIRPIMQVVSLPITVLTLGIFYFVVNALAINVASWLSINIFHVGVYVVDFWAALWGSIVISIVSSIVNGIIGVED